MTAAIVTAIVVGIIVFVSWVNWDVWIPRLHYRIRGYPIEWPPARVVKAAFPQDVPQRGKPGKWVFACGDCKITWEAEVWASEASSFHPPCPGCEEKLGAYLRSRR